MPTTGDIIKARLKSKQLTQSDLARIVGVQPSSVNQWISGRSRIDQERLVAVANALDVTVADLIEGNESEVLKPKGRDAALATISLPYLSAKSPSSINLVDCLPVGGPTWPVLQRWIDPQVLYMVIEVEGHAMEPELRDGSTVLAESINLEVMPYEPGGIYAIRYASRIVVRRIKDNDLRQGFLVLHSDNSEKHGTITIPLNELECAWRIISILHQPVR